MIDTGGDFLPTLRMCYDNGTLYTDDHFEIKRTQLGTTNVANCSCIVQQLADTTITVDINRFTCENGDNCPWKLQIFKDGCEVFSDCSTSWETNILCPRLNIFFQLCPNSRIHHNVWTAYYNWSWWWVNFFHTVIHSLPQLMCMVYYSRWYWHTFSLK